MPLIWNSRRCSTTSSPASWRHTMDADDRIPQGKYVVPALAQGLAILSLFSRRRATITPPEIAQELTLPRSTVFRLLHTLQVMGFVQKEGDERHFKLGPAVIRHGFK